MSNIQAQKEIYKAYALRNKVFGKQCNVVITYYEKTAYNQEKELKSFSQSLGLFGKAKSKLNRV